jgi:hypothetical protein
MTGRIPPRSSTGADHAVSSRRSRKNRYGTRGIAGLFAAVCSATLVLGGPATARPLEDEDSVGPKFVLGGRASLDPVELGKGGWSIVTEAPDLVELVAGAARVRIVVDAALGGSADDPSKDNLVAALADTAGLMPAKYVTRPAVVFAVFAADLSSTVTAGQDATRLDTTAGGCTTLPWQVATPTGVTLTGEGDAKVVLGTPCTVERAYVVTRGSGNLLIEAQAPRGTDGGEAPMDAMDDLVMTLVPASARIDDNPSPISYTRR